MSMQWIAGQTLGTAGSITFSSIPATFTHLQLRLFLRCDAAAVNSYLGGYFNSDSTTNYARHNLLGDGSTAQSSATTSANLWAVDSAVAGASLTTGVFSVSIIDILDYTSTTKNKTVRTLSGYDNNGSGSVRLNSNLWFKTPEAINRIDIFTGGSFIAGSRFDLYGITSSQVTGA